MSVRLGDTIISGLGDQIPTQTGKDGKFLSTDGTELSWEDVDALPDQTGKNGKYLKTNGTTATWEEVAGSGTTITYWTDD